ncbi:winged helix-turn-helix domain-containing protein [Luteimonas sp. SX5]|uniref:Winged helix-turn-helix domain-containing protein n=1 Tax=Luteimonas galliterrae TaxID=2940486 RepID=A0ABT0MFJ4_9GAMM|nr:winged helix-turn-helix domain-containing protein [Luteimonas galliterrae]MCL1633647.1 winged helix-turn-helix domain-containing protein [Luteimonas galliterrae]
MTIARYRFGEYVLDLATRELRLRGQPVALPARVFECLICLIEHRDRAVSRDELVHAVFGRADVSDAQLAQIVLRARRAVGDDGHEQRSIRTVPRYGFRWLEQTQAEMMGDDGASADTPPAFAAAPELSAPVAPAAPARSAWRRHIRWLGGAAALIVLAWLGWMLMHRAPPVVPGLSQRIAEAAPSGRTILVLPTAVAEPNDAPWARLGLMDFVADRLHRAGLPVLPSETVLSVLRERASKDDNRALRRATRAVWIVESRARQTQDAWEVALTATDAAGIKQRGQARHADLLEAARLAADRLSPTLGGSRSPAGSAEPALAERLQRARAAMLANEIETARRILLEAPELQRSQPQLQYQLARVDFRAGEYPRGLATLDHALASEEARRDPAFHARLLNARGAMLIRLDRYAEAERAYDQVTKLIGGGGHPAELGQALSGRAVAYSLQKRYDLALADLGRARVQLVARGDALAVARVDANLGILEFDRQRPAHALPYLEKAAEDFKAMGAMNELATVRKVLMGVQVALLRTDAALAESERAWAMLPRMRDPSQRADLILTRAEVLIVAGRLREAGTLLAMPEAALAVPADYGRRDYLRVDLARRGGEGRQAVAMADAALRAWPPQSNPRLRAWTAFRREQAALAADLAPSSGNAITPYGDTLPERLTLASLQRARGDTAAAETTYRAAVALAEQEGVPEETAIAIDAYASWLLERGRTAEAGALIGRVAPWAEHDFDMAVLQVRLLRALGQRPQWPQAYDRAKRLAGERAIPASLDPTLSEPAKSAASGDRVH